MGTILGMAVGGPLGAGIGGSLGSFGEGLLSGNRAGQGAFPTDYAGRNAWVQALMGKKKSNAIGSGSIGGGSAARTPVQ